MTDDPMEAPAPQPASPFQVLIGMVALIAVSLAILFALVWAVAGYVHLLVRAAEAGW